MAYYLMAYYLNGELVSKTAAHAALDAAIRAQGLYGAEDIWAAWYSARFSEDARETLTEYGIEIVI